MIDSYSSCLYETRERYCFTYILQHRLKFEPASNCKFTTSVLFLLSFHCSSRRLLHLASFRLRRRPRCQTTPTTLSSSQERGVTTTDNLIVPHLGFPLLSISWTNGSHRRTVFRSMRRSHALGTTGSTQHPGSNIPLTTQKSSYATCYLPGRQPLMGI